jgi:hypothetical protein
MMKCVAIPDQMADHYIFPKNILYIPSASSWHLLIERTEACGCPLGFTSISIKHKFRI